MSIGALFTKQWSGNFYGKNPKSSAKGETSALQWIANAAPELMNPGKREESDKAGAVEAAKAPLSYSRRITADFKTEMLTAGQNEKGEVCYSYEASRQKFEVIINVNGDERNYLIKGTDSEGNSFEKEFDPYDIDPENADYTEFTALCLYIQKTDRYADDVMRNFAQPENILEKTNYVGVLFAWSIEQAQNGNMESFEDARRLIVAIQEFTFSKREIELPVSEELIDLLFVEQDEAEEKEVAEREKSGTYYWEQAFDSIGKNAPESVKQAWLDAAAVVGADGMGITKNGMMDHISQLMVQRLLKIYRGESADDILGSSAASAIKAVNSALYDLEHPLDGNRGRTPEQMKKREIEKKFYQVFLKRLHAI